MAITPTKNTNSCTLWVGGSDFSTTLCPEEFGGLDTYIEQTEGWKPACARVFMTASQWYSLGADVRAGTAPVGIAIGGNAGIPDENRVDEVISETATALSTAEIFYAWRVNTHKSGTVTALYEVEFRTQQQWWDAKRITKAWNCLDAAGTAVVAEEGSTAEISTWEEILTDLWTESGILPTPPTITGAPTYYTPLNLRLRGTPFSVALRRVLDVARCSLSHDIYQDTFAVNPNGASVLPSTSFDTKYLLNGDKPSLVGLAGDVVPTAVVCMFPKADGGYDTETKLATAFGGAATGPASFEMPFHVGDYSAETLAASITGLATAAQIADDLSKAVIKNAMVQRRRYLIPGHAWPVAIGSQTAALGWSMHPDIRYRKVSLCGVRAGDMAPGLTTYIETGPILYPEAELHRINSPVVGGEVAVRWRPDGTTDIFAGTPPVQPFIRLTGKTLSSGTVNAWDYNWALLTYDPITDEFIPADPSVTQETDGYLPARNSLERRNPTGALSGGTGDMPIGSGLPITSGTLKGIGTTSGQEADVPCWFKSVNTGTEEEPVMKLRPIFCVPNSFDCEGA